MGLDDELEVRFGVAENLEDERIFGCCRQAKLGELGGLRGEAGFDGEWHGEFETGPIDLAPTIDHLREQGVDLRCVIGHAGKAALPDESVDVGHRRAELNVDIHHRWLSIGARESDAEVGVDGAAGCGVGRG